MTEPVDIADAADPRLADYVGLTDAELRQRHEPAAGLFMAEGDKVIRRALAAGCRPRSLLVASRWLPRLAAVLAGFDAPVYVAPEAVLEQVTGYRVHRGPLAAMWRPAALEPAELLAGARRAVVLEDVVDHANVGAVFRTAAAFGFDAVLLSPRCADPLYRRALKVSMGAVLALGWARFGDWYQALDTVRSAGLRSVALTPDAGAVDLAGVDLPDRVALVLGAEGDGLSRRWLESADVRARIPISSAVDSLNVAAAAAAACYALSVANGGAGDATP
ncbi:MAG: rRNA methyltransferase [Streptosporangiales bacterium]|nr:rRNA methyltransferase [Streptosporangiales bacterium]